MNRAEYRRNVKEHSKPSKVFTLNQSQIDQLKKQAVDEATKKAFILMLSIPCEVLVNEGYWEKTAKKRMPIFLGDVMSLYTAYEQGVLPWNR